MKRFAHILLFSGPLVLLLLTGCAAGITGLELDQTSTALRAKSVCDQTGSVCGVSDADFVPFRVLGQGVCGEIGIDFGDGTQLSHQGDFTTRPSPGVFLEAHKYGPARTGDPLDREVWGEGQAVPLAIAFSSLSLGSSHRLGTVFGRKLFHEANNVVLNRVVADAVMYGNPSR